MTITSHGLTFKAYCCEHIGASGCRCNVRFTDPADIPLHMLRHKKTDQACIATEWQKKDGHKKSEKPKPKKRWMTTGAGLGRIKLTRTPKSVIKLGDYSHRRKKF